MQCFCVSVCCCVDSHLPSKMSKSVFVRCFFCATCVTKLMFVFSFLPTIVRNTSLRAWTECKGPKVWNWSAAHIVLRCVCLTLARVNTMGLISSSCRLSFHFKWLRRPLSPSGQQKVDDSRSECNYFRWAAAAKSQFVSSVLCLFYIWASAQTRTTLRFSFFISFFEKGRETWISAAVPDLPE